jgi:O-succinylbenzoate synthase
MQIDAVDLFRLALAPCEASATPDRETVLVCLHSGSQQGWGEATLDRAPWRKAEWTGGAFALLRDWLAPTIVGQTIDTGEALQERLNLFAGNSFAKASLDAAWWSLEAQVRNQTLIELVTGSQSSGGSKTTSGSQSIMRPRSTLPISRRLRERETIDELLVDVDKAVQAGYRQLTLETRHGWDLRMLEAVRRHHPQLAIAADCQASYTLDDFDMFCRFDDFHLAWIEQPLTGDDLIDHARLQGALRTPLALGESITSIARAEQAIDLGSCRVVNLNPGCVGGLTVARRIADMLTEAGIDYFITTSGATIVAAASVLALASRPDCKLPADCDPRAIQFGELPIARGDAHATSDSPQTAQAPPSVATNVDYEINEELLRPLIIERATLAAPDG